MYSVEIDWAPAHELLTSLGAFLNVADQKVMDLGTAWARTVRQQLGPNLLALLSPRESVRHIALLDLLIWQCPRERDASSFVCWLRSLTLGELYELLAPHAGDRSSMMPRDLSAWRDRGAETLSLWNDEYFKDVDPAILSSLRTDADVKRALLDTMAPDELVEMATNGVHYVPEPLPDVVLLIPQYHYRPWNTFSSFRRMRIVYYPVDPLPTTPGEPPPRLLRTTRVLGDESRLRILRFLGAGSRTFTELVQLTGLSKSTVNHHMMTLRAAGLVRVIERGAAHDHVRRRTTYELRLGAIDELNECLRAYLTAEPTPTNSDERHHATPA